MQAEHLVKEIERLNKEARSNKMDSLTVREKINQVFNLGEQLLMHYHDPIHYSVVNGMIQIGRQYLNQYEKYNFDLAYYSGSILFDWSKYQEQVKQEIAETERRKELTELRRQGKI
jgi:hypothetical protein